MLCFGQGEVQSTSSVSVYLHTILFLLPSVNCGIPHAPENGIIENFQSISTVGGAQIFFRCNESFVPAGRMRSTCTPSNASWTPNPADLVCNGESQNRCKTPLGICTLWWLCRILSRCVVKLINISSQCIIMLCEA